MILVLNCGSQSIKWKLFQKTGDDFRVIKENKREVLNQNDFEKILNEELQGLKEVQLEKIGHRVVLGKDIFREPTEITKENIRELESLSRLAPLHSPFNALGIKTCQKIFPNVPQIAVFDTEFYKDLPDYAYTYALPEKIADEFGFRRYGFHGISHEYAAKEGAKKIKKPFNNIKIISCHLGGGASITAIKNGKAVDTSMGFTPMEGLVMMTRAGNIDSEVVLELVREFSIEKAAEILNKESGVKGICGQGDMLEVFKQLESKEPLARKEAELALKVFVYSIQKYIGSYFAILSGCDLLVFTGPIGSGTPDNRKVSGKIRKMVCQDLKILSKTKILAIDTDEELAIAQKIINR